MRRRTIVIGAACASLLPDLAWAQSTRAPGKIGVVNVRPVTITVATMRPAWQRLGYVEGESLLLRNADGDLSRLPGIIGELIDHGVGVLIVVGAEALRVAHRLPSALRKIGRAHV